MNRPILVVLAICCMAIIAGASLADELAGNAVVQTPEVAPASGTAASEPAIKVDEDYRLMEEDILRLDVWGEQQLTNMQMQVTPDGKINVAYLGDVQASGLTLAELTADIARKFEKAEILINPKIQITLITMHQHTVRVLGEVKQPGVVVFKDGDTLLDAIAQAGSYTDNAWLEKASVSRKGATAPIPVDIKKMLDGDLSQNFEIKKGDIIVIPPEDYENKVYVMGQVARPGIFDLKDNTTVLAAINLAGGPTDRASVRKTRVMRGDPKNPQTVACDLTKLLNNADLSQDITLQPGDVVMVPESSGPNWNKWSQILSTIVNFSYLGRIF